MAGSNNNEYTNTMKGQTVWKKESEKKEQRKTSTRPSQKVRKRKERIPKKIRGEQLHSKDMLISTNEAVIKQGAFNC